MKFLIDESVEYRLVTFLRNLDYDTSSIAESTPGLDDEKVLSIAYKKNRILITNDKDFGELIYRLSVPHKGIILFRLIEESYQSKINKLEYILNKFKEKLSNNYTTVSDTKIRFRA